MKQPQPRYSPNQQGTIDAGTQVPDSPVAVPAGYALVSQDAMSRVLEEQARWIAGKDRIVDEYRVQTLAGDSELIISLLPQFERLWERIERVIITGPSQGSTGLEIEGSVTSPGANANIAQLTNIPPGVYTVNWTVELDGTVSATDVDNFKLTAGSSTVVVGTNDGAIGRYPQTPVEVSIASAGLSIKTVAAGTTGAVYSASMSLIPINGFPVTVQLGDRVWPLVIPNTGIINISTDALLLSPQMIRQLTATFAGDYSFELIGYADVRNAPF